jgi:hypothetical protein
MSRKEVTFEERLTRDEAISAAFFAVGHVQDAAVRIAAFLSSRDEHQLAEVARKMVDEVDELHRLLKARNPGPWNYQDETEGRKA